MAYEHKRQHWSNWHITINTNQHERTAAQRQTNGRILADAVRDACEIPAVLWSWLRHFSNGNKIQFTPHMMGAVTRIRSRVSLEIGPDAANTSVHCHWLLEVEHRTRLQIDAVQLREQIEELTGFRGTHINIRFVKGAGDDKEYLLRYLQKDGVPRGVAQNADNRALQQSLLIDEMEQHL